LVVKVKLGRDAVDSGCSMFDATANGKMYSSTVERRVGHCADLRWQPPVFVPQWRDFAAPSGGLPYVCREPCALRREPIQLTTGNPQTI